MHQHILTWASRLSDEALHSRLKELASRERDATVELVAHLAVLLGRKKHLGQGWGSVYAWCRDTLHLSEDAAYNRVAAARAVRKFPAILDHLAAGFVNVTTVKVLRPILTAMNLQAILAEAKYRSRKECELIVARLQPKPDVPSTIRKLPVSSAVPPTARITADRGMSVGAGQEPPSEHHMTTPAPGQPAPPVHHPVLAPLTPERYRLQFTISKDTHDKLRRVQDLLCREVPSGDPADIFDRALDVLLVSLEKKKRAAAANPRTPRPTTDGSRAIPAHVARVVWRRDGDRCAFVGTAGRCKETRYLELHHLEPYGHHGPATVENVSVRCRAHNVYESELIFGPFDASAVRETPENYAVCREFSAVPERFSARAVIRTEPNLRPGRTGCGSMARR
jgi:hypothetical protein